MKPNPQTFGATCGDEGGTIAHRQDAIEWSAGSKGFDIALLGLGLKAKWRRAIAPGIVQDMAAIGGQDQIDTEPLGCAVELGHLIARFGCD